MTLVLSGELKKVDKPLHEAGRREQATKMSNINYREIQLSEEQLLLTVEALEMLRVYQQGFSDAEGQLKLQEVKRLEDRMRRKLTLKGSGATGRYAAKL